MLDWKGGLELQLTHRRSQGWCYRCPTLSSGRVPRCSLLCHVKQVRARFKRTHHASGSLKEHIVGNMVKQMAFKGSSSLRVIQDGINRHHSGA
jgi:hypothetical protein